MRTLCKRVTASSDELRKMPRADAPSSRRGLNVRIPLNAIPEARKRISSRDNFRAMARMYHHPVARMTRRIPRIFELRANKGIDSG